MTTSGQVESLVHAVHAQNSTMISIQRGDVQMLYVLLVFFFLFSWWHRVSGVVGGGK